jgi:predicted O-linked N-acetylglucosamine transferase (SPINDLY family)
MTQANIDQSIRIALQHHQAGRLAEAERIYRQVLAQQPDHADALHLLGVLAGQAGRFDVGVDLIRRAIGICSTDASFHFNLGNAQTQMGQLDQAIASFRQAIRLNPDYAEAHTNLGNILRDMGQLDEASAACRRAIQLKPDLAEAHNNLGNALTELEQLDEAIASFRQAVRLKPDFAEAHSNLGNSLQKKGQLDEAIAACRRAIALNPNLARAHNSLGDALKNKEQPDEAIASYREAIRLKPDFAEAHNNLGNALKDKRQFDEAMASYRQAIRLKPDLAMAHSNLGNVLTEMRQHDQAVAACRQAIRLKPDLVVAHGILGNALAELNQLDEAVASHRQAIRLKPDFAEVHGNLASALKDLGQLDEAIASYRQAVRLKPGFAEAHSNLLLALNYHPDIDAHAVLAEHRTWSDQFASPLAGEITSHANERSPDRRLRVGYVSADFRHHSIGYFLLPLLEHHDREILEIFCYSCAPRADDLTARIKRSCDTWRDIRDLADPAVAQLIRSDGIDILVDLSGHTGGNRLRAFARKPAPIQVTYLGYANTTGMTAIDFRLTDALADPPGMTDELNVEKLWRLPACAWCYDPLEAAPDIHPRPNGPITFGCFNAFAKINRKMVAIWAELLRRVAGSRLLLKSAGAGEASSRSRLTDQFAECGISGDRIEMRGKIEDSRGHLELYGRLDVALDTYPYHGTTTTCEALWMGVPVVSLAGRTHVSRVGVSLLHNVGLPELIAETPQQYVQIAADLATDLPRLAELRRTLRPRMRASVLMDAPRFARNIEAAYRQMWRNWCATEKGD